MAQLQQ
jgi:hypothetical protein